MSIIGKAEKPLPHNNNTMKKLILARGVLAASLFCCMSLGNTACVNRIDEESEAEIEEGTIIRKSKFPQNPKRSVRFSGKRTKRSVQKRKARNTQKAETKVL